MHRIYGKHKIRLCSYRMGLLFTHMNSCGVGCGGAISVTEQRCAALISKAERHITDRFSAILWCSVLTYLVRRVGEVTGTH